MLTQILSLSPRRLFAIGVLVAGVLLGILLIILWQVGLFDSAPPPVAIESAVESVTQEQQEQAEGSSQSARHKRSNKRTRRSQRTHSPRQSRVRNNKRAQPPIQVPMPSRKPSPPSRKRLPQPTIHRSRLTRTRPLNSRKRVRSLSLSRLKRMFSSNPTNKLNKR